MHRQIYPINLNQAINKRNAAVAERNTALYANNERNATVAERNTALNAKNERNVARTERNTALPAGKQSCKHQLICSTIVMVAIVGCCLTGVIVVLTTLESNAKLRTDVTEMKRRLDVLDKVVQAVKTQQNYSDQQVAFSVNRPFKNLTIYGTPTFRVTKLNTGGGYNETTGTFTCPVPGVYSFSVSIHHDDTDTGNPWCHPRVNRDSKGLVTLPRIANVQASVTVIVQLNVSDVVDLRCRYWEHVKEDSNAATFSGVLITPS